MSNLTERPTKEEYGGHFGTYIDAVPEGNIVDILAEDLKATSEFLSDLPLEKAEYRYAADKWTIKEVIGHIADTERIMSYRLLRIARGDSTPLPGFDQDEYMKHVNFNASSLADLIADYIAVRKATLTLVHSLADEAWGRKGTASNTVMSVKALAYVIAGHGIHHIRIVKDRYLA